MQISSSYVNRKTLKNKISTFYSGDTSYLPKEFFVYIFGFENRLLRNPSALFIVIIPQKYFGFSRLEPFVEVWNTR